MLEAAEELCMMRCHLSGSHLQASFPKENFLGLFDIAEK